MTNPKIETDLAKILSQIDNKLDKIDEKFEQKLDKIDEKFEQKYDKLDEKLNKLSEDINELKIGQAKTDGKIDALDAKTDQIDKRISNQEFFVRGIFIGLLIVIFGGFAMFLWMTSKF